MSAAGKRCALLRKTCIEDKCSFWMQLRGAHPQSGDPVDEYDCAFRWQVILQIEGAKETRQAAAAIESFRNEMVAQGERVLRVDDTPARPSLPFLVDGVGK